jgi:hypothetical protein
MINVLNSLISSIILPFGFAISYLVLLLINPVGFVVVFLSLMFFEYKTAISIIKNTDLINFKQVFNYIKKYKRKDVSLIFPQWTVLDIISKNKNVGTGAISKNIGATMAVTRKIMSGLFNDGYITREVNIYDRRAFCYAISDKYEKQKKYNNL